MQTQVYSKPAVKTTSTPEDAQEAILAKAREMDAHRKIRAIYRVGEWQASPRDNGATLIHRHETDVVTGEAKTYSDTSALRNGFDCSCGDAAQYIRPMRRRVAALLCGTPVACQHVHARMLLRGGKLMVFCPKTGDLLASAVLGPDGVRAQVSVETGMGARWEALVADATKCWGDKAIKPAKRITPAFCANCQDIGHTEADCPQPDRCPDPWEDAAGQARAQGRRGKAMVA